MSELSEFRVSLAEFDVPFAALSHEFMATATTAVLVLLLLALLVQLGDRFNRRYFNKSSFWGVADAPPHTPLIPLRRHAVELEGVPIKRKKGR